MTSHPDLPYEQARNTEYLRKLERKLDKNPLVSVERNVIWIDGADHQIAAEGFHHPLLGRVGCAGDDADVRDFYIGSRYIGDGDLLVYSWAAPIARLFFQPDHNRPEEVVVRRTFTHRVKDVSGLDDELVRPGVPSPFLQRELQVPAPVRSGVSRRRAVPRSRGGSTPTPDVADSGLDGMAEQADRSNEFHAGMRAKSAVLRRLAAPRTDRLQSVLALLQPDQHDLVSWPVDKNLAVQGHPGTGKTVVAAYRAAYLVNPALYADGGLLSHRANRPLRVLVVGPTSGYVSHVAQLVETLAPASQVRITHLTDLMAETTGLRTQWPGGIGGEHDDVDAQARVFAERAARIHEASSRWSDGNGARRENIKAVYDLIANNGTRDRPLVANPDGIAWMRKLPPFEQAIQRRYLPLMAQCRLAYNPIPEASRFDHIIVDEAQDVSPIEWNVLDQYLARNGHWTLVGDMNQRRSDVTYSSWREIADHLALSEVDDFEPEIMRRGYRSTGAVLSFADKLLPARLRGSRTVQDKGEPVGLHRVSKAGELWTRALDVAASLCRKHPDGSTAIITVNPGELIRELGRQEWRREGSGFDTWRRGNRRLRLFPPEEARGLEFDAVVVVEPGAFPENLGRTGQLYTSLTRANRELALVWHGSLPDPLRRAARTTAVTR